MNTFSLLKIDVERKGDRLKPVPGGVLAEPFRPFIDQFFQVINSLKVIARKGDASVFNLYNPPMPTKAGMRALERKVKEVVFKMPFPATANLAVTFKCQCKCVHCSADPFVTGEGRELTTGELKKVIDGALDLGASLVIFTGGEPLLRKDLFELIEYVDADKAQPMIFTNGQYLTEENAGRLAEAGLATLNISIDDLDPKEHDRLRGIKGLFKMAMEGAERARKKGILTGVSTYATSERLRSGKVEGLIQLAQKEGFHEITIFDCIPSGKFLKEAGRMLSPEEKKELTDLGERYHWSDHPMGVITQALVNSPEGAGCFGAYSQFYMTAYGDINPCDFNPISFGNVLQLPIQAIWNRMVHHPDFKERHMTCRMQAQAYREKYIDHLPENPHLPIPIEDYEGRC